jgi:hypothetical protein
MSITLLILALGPPAATAQSLQVEPACGGQGLRGWLAEDGVAISFESCETPEGFRSRIWTGPPAGVPMTEVVKERGLLTYRIAGVDVSEPAGGEQTSRMNDVMKSPESRLAVSLWGRLKALGLRTDTVPMAALGANLVGYEAGESPRPGSPGP